MEILHLVLQICLIAFVLALTVGVVMLVLHPARHRAEISQKDQAAAQSA